MADFRPYFLLWLLGFLAVPSAFSQGAARQDSLQGRLRLLQELVQSANYEKAQVEAEELRMFLQRRRQPVPPLAVELISKTYRANKDERSAFRFLSEADLDARRDPNPVTKAALLTVLVREFGRWQMPEAALAAQQMLSVARDSAQARQRRAELRQIALQLDSLQALRREEQAAERRYVRLERDRAFLLAGVGALAFFVLIFANARSQDRWRRRLEQKDLEMDVLRTNLRHIRNEGAQMAGESATPAPMAVASAPTARPQGAYWFPGGEKPQQIALVIEPNRQVVLYLKSLLADRFQVETAHTANEGLQLANSLLPDLIVCDAQLNGKTGIDVVRQCKLSERTNHIPIILLSDKTGNDGRLDALRAGADHWFTRPVLDEEFDAQVLRLLDGHKARHQEFARYLHLFFTDHRPALDNPFLQRTVQEIEQHLGNPDFTAEDIARRMQMSKAHFSKKLRVLTGKEPIQLIREMRLEKAKVLLEKRAGMPQAIAEMVGFSSPGTFALAFKDYFGENTLLLHSGRGSV
jgi:DNA-binding response OmpR family regulator